MLKILAKLDTIKNRQLKKLFFYNLRLFFAKNFVSNLKKNLLFNCQNTLSEKGSSNKTNSALPSKKHVKLTKIQVANFINSIFQKIIRESYQTRNVDLLNEKGSKNIQILKNQSISKNDLHKKSIKELNDSMEESKYITFIYRLHKIIKNLKKTAYKIPFRVFKKKVAENFIFFKIEEKMMSFNNDLIRVFFQLFANKKSFIFPIKSKKSFIENSFSGDFFLKHETDEELKSIDQQEDFMSKQKFSPSNNFRNLKSITISSRDQFFTCDIKIESVRRIHRVSNNSEEIGMAISHFEELKNIAQNPRLEKNDFNENFKKSLKPEIIWTAKTIWRSIKQNALKLLTVFFYRLKNLPKKKVFQRDSKILYPRITPLKNIFNDWECKEFTRRVSLSRQLDNTIGWIKIFYEK